MCESTNNPHTPHFRGRSYDFVEYGLCQNWIGGQWRPAASGETLAVENPRHGRAMGAVAMSGAAEVAEAVAAAAAALAAWAATPIKERAQVMYRLKALMERDFAELVLAGLARERQDHRRGRGRRGQGHRVRGVRRLAAQPGRRRRSSRSAAA